MVLERLGDRFPAVHHYSGHFTENRKTCKTLAKKCNFRNFEYGKNFNVVMKNWKTFFFAVFEIIERLIHDMAVILQILGLWPLKKIQKIFFHFYEFFLKIWYKKGQKSCIFNKKLKNVFFLRPIPFWVVFLRWCTLKRPKMGQNSWKFIFPDFSDNSREKTNFCEFLLIFGHPTVHHFYGGLQFRAKWRHS